MGKRKRGGPIAKEDHEPLEGQKLRKVNQVAQSPDPSRIINSTAQAKPCTIIANEPTVPETLEPPPDLNKRQRRKWRLKHRKAADVSAPSHAHGDVRIGTGADVLSGGLTSPINDKTSNKALTNAPIDRSLFQSITQTSLMVPPVKQWLDPTPGRKANGGTAQVRPVKENLANPLDRDSTKTSNTATTSSIRPDPGIKPARNHPSRAPRKQTTNQPAPAVERPNHASSRSRMNAPSVGGAGLSISSGLQSVQRALSVPAHTGPVNAEHALTRLNNFLRGSDGSSSDEESESDSDSESGSESESETYLAAGPITKSPAAAVDVQVVIPQNVTSSNGASETGVEKSSGSESDNDNTTSSSQSVTGSSGHEDNYNDNASNAESEESGESGSDDEDIASNLETDTESSSTSSQSLVAVEKTDNKLALSDRPHDVGIRRPSSSFRDLGSNVEQVSSIQDTETPSSTQHSEALLSFSSNLATFDDGSTFDSQEINRTIEDLSREVFNATRAVPSSKPHSKALPKLGSLKVTHAPSDYGLIKGRPWNSQSIEVPLPVSPLVYIVNTVDTRFGNNALSQLESEFEVVTDTANGADSIEVHSLPSSESSSSLSTLTATPSPPSTLQADVEGSPDGQIFQTPATTLVQHHAEIPTTQGPAGKKRKMTGATSKHFTPTKPKRSRKKSDEYLTECQQSYLDDVAISTPSGQENDSSSPSVYYTPEEPQTRSKTRKTASRKSTGKTSTHFSPAHTPSKDVAVATSATKVKKKRVPAGVSANIAPPISAERFGIIQEKLWDQPFWLIIAVTFLNKTTGKAAAPVFWRLKELYPSPQALANADEDELCDMIYHLGLQTQRSRRLIKIARAWMEGPPVKGRRYRVLHYPLKEDGKQYKRTEVVEEDEEACAGALEMGHIPGCGPYAWDSWRMFCRDVLRGVAEDYNGRGATSKDFVPEWQRVLPLDKELRACLRWMWLREGWIWNHETGERRRATEEEIRKAEKGEMEMEDEQERKFAMQAAGVDGEEAADDPIIEAAALDESEAPSPKKKNTRTRRKRSVPLRALGDDEHSESDDVDVTPNSKILRSGKLAG